MVESSGGLPRLWQAHAGAPAAAGGFRQFLAAMMQEGSLPLLVIYGVGRPEQHLARDLARWLAQQLAVRQTAFWSGRQLLRSYQDAVQTKTLEAFRQSLVSARVLAVDSLEAICRHSGLQELLAGVLEEVEGSGGTCVVATSRSLTQWGCFTPRLKARLEAGLCLPRPALAPSPQEEEPPGESARPEGERASPLASSSANPSLGKAGSLKGKKARSGLARLARVVARLWGVSVADLRGNGRHRAVATARHLAMFIARERLRLSLENIGRYFGGRDHTTVAHACRRIAAQLATDAELRGSLAAVDAALLPLLSPKEH